MYILFVLFTKKADFERHIFSSKILCIIIFCQDNQDGHLRRGALHLQAQRQGQEGQVVHQEPGQILKKCPSFFFTKIIP